MGEMNQKWLGYRWELVSHLGTAWNKKQKKWKKTAITLFAFQFPVQTRVSDVCQIKSDLSSVQCQQRRKKKNILHLRHQSPAASGQTGSEELRSPAFPWLCFCSSHIQSLRVSTYTTMCFFQRPRLHCSPTHCCTVMLMASVKLEWVLHLGLQVPW